MPAMGVIPATSAYLAHRPQSGMGWLTMPAGAFLFLSGSAIHRTLYISRVIHCSASQQR